MRNFFKHFFISIIVGIVTFLFILILFLVDGRTIGIEWVKEGLAINFGYAIPLYFISAYTFDTIQMISSKKNWNQWKSASIAFPIVILLNAVCIILIQYLIYTFLFNKSYFSYNVIDSIKLPLYISITIGSAFYILNFIFRYQKEKNKINKESLLNEKQTHEALKSTIGPHFLFNSLNVLNGLIEENPNRAQKFVSNLADVYRYVLERKNDKWVSVESEMKFAEKYLELIATRFEDGLEVIVQDKLKTSNKMIAPLTLQLLIENCVKHNSIAQSKPLKIQIYQKNDFLIVENNINFKRQINNRIGLGLKQIKQRYQLLNKEILIVNTGVDFKVKIPLVSKTEIN